MLVRISYALAMAYINSVIDPASDESRSSRHSFEYSTKKRCISDVKVEHRYAKEYQYYVSMNE